MTKFCLFIHKSLPKGRTCGMPLEDPGHQLGLPHSMRIYVTRWRLLNQVLRVSEITHETVQPAKRSPQDVLRLTRLFRRCAARPQNVLVAPKPGPRMGQSHGDCEQEDGTVDECISKNILCLLEAKGPNSSCTSKSDHIVVLNLRARPTLRLSFPECQLLLFLQDP